MALSLLTIWATTGRPSGAATTDSSWVGPEVICSGAPSGKRCRQICEPLPVVAVMYIHRPSGDHAAEEQRRPDGPTLRPAELPSKGSTRHSWMTPAESISEEISTHFRSGERREEWAMPRSVGG